MSPMVSTVSTVDPTLISERSVSTEAASAPPRIVHSASLPDVLRRLGVSLLITTYQADRLAIVREDGDGLNTHLRTFPTPMGMAVANGRLAIGTRMRVWEFVDTPSAAGKLEPRGRHDACYLLRSSHVTGAIQVHEMAFDDEGDLWFVNTRFSCLCTLGKPASFTPRWRPRFVTALEPTDRCHLNGLAMVDGRPRYVTALSQTDEPAGWRADKAKGGVVIDAESGEVVVRGLAMPHSPRWRDGRLWICESGAGTIGLVDLEAGRYEPVVEVPGFTRGVEFVGDLAFVGLSQVRESAVFSGVPLTERLDPEERVCGVCVIDVARGVVIGFLRFETVVEEVFAVVLLPNQRYPELIKDDEPLLRNSFTVPDAAWGDVPTCWSDPASRTPGASG